MPEIMTWTSKSEYLIYLCWCELNLSAMNLDLVHYMPARQGELLFQVISKSFLARSYGPDKQIPMFYLESAAVILAFVPSNFKIHARIYGLDQPFGMHTHIHETTGVQHVAGKILKNVFDPSHMWDTCALNPHCVY